MAKNATYRTGEKHYSQENIAIDELDRKILYWLDIDARQSANDIAKKAGSNKDTVNYRLHKLIENGLITRFSTATDTARFGYQNIKAYFQFQNMDRKKEKEFFGYVRHIPSMGWMVKSQGRWDALVLFWSKSSFEFHAIFTDLVNRFSRHISSKEIIHSINWTYYNRKWLFPEEHRIHTTIYGNIPGHEKLDNIDKKTMKALISNPKKPVKDIALALGMSSQNIINRIKSLRKRNIITKFGIDLDYGKIDMIFCKTFIYLGNVTPDGLQDICRYCSQEPYIICLTTTLGAWDLELEFEVPRFEKMVEIMGALKEKFKDIIRGYESIIITDQTEIRYIGE